MQERNLLVNHSKTLSTIKKPRRYTSISFCALYAFTVFAKSIVTVIGPTPPGTGVI